MKNLFICTFISLIILGCGSSKYKNIEIIGCAIEGKSSVGIVSEIDGKIYYLEGIRFWEDEIRYRKILVKGNLKTEYLEQKFVGDSIPVQQLVGNKFTILNAKWKLQGSPNDTINCLDLIEKYYDNE